MSLSSTSWLYTHCFSHFCLKNVGQDVVFIWELHTGVMFTRQQWGQPSSWSIPRKGWYGGHGVLEHGRTVPTAWSHDLGTDSQQRLLMNLRPSAGSPRFLTGLLWWCRQDLRFPQEHLLCPMVAWTLWLNSEEMQLFKANKVTVGSLYLWLHALVSAWNSAVGRKRKEARWEILWRRSRKQVDCFVSTPTAAAGSLALQWQQQFPLIPGEVPSPVSPYRGDQEVHASWWMTQAQCAYQPCQGLCFCFLQCWWSPKSCGSGSWKSLGWEMMLLSAQAFATVVTPMRPLVPWSSCSCGEAKKGAEICSAAAFERCRRHCF